MRIRYGSPCKGLVGTAAALTVPPDPAWCEPSQDYITDVRTSADGKLLATASWDGTARVWSLETGKLLAVLRGHLVDPSPRRRQVLLLAFAPQLQGDFNFLLTIGTDGRCLLWKYRLDSLEFDTQVRCHDSNRGDLLRIALNARPVPARRIMHGVEPDRVRAGHAQEDQRARRHL